MEKIAGRNKDLIVLMQGAVSSTILNLSGILLVYVYHMVLAKIMGTDNYGVFSYALIVINFMTVIGLMGLQTGTLRFSAAYASKNEMGRFKGVIMRSHQIALASGIILVVTITGL